MKLAAVRDLARQGKLYPALILHGGRAAARREAAVALARTLLCGGAPEERPCGVCAHCRRIAWPGEEGAPFHPDFAVLERDLRTATSVEAAREFVRAARLTPYEARGQVFVVAAAESLSGEAANALLKLLEEPPARAPRHFLLLAPSQLDLLPTLRSRSLALYLGAGGEPDAQEVEPLAAGFAAALGSYLETGAPVYLLAAAGALAAAGGWEDPRAEGPWILASAAVLAAARRLSPPPRLGRGLLALAEDLLGAPSMRVRGIRAERILEGLVARHLAASAPRRFA